MEYLTRVRNFQILKLIGFDLLHPTQLQEHHTDLTFARVSQVFDKGSITVVFKKIFKAYMEYICLNFFMFLQGVLCMQFSG